MPFQSEKQKKWMWANKPEMAREWTEEYGSKVKAKTGTMAKTDDKWIQKATKNMRKDKPCTGDKFGGPTCPKGSRRYNLAKTFKKMNKPKKAFLGKMFRKSSTATPTSGGSSGGGSSGMGGLLRRLFEEKKHLFRKAGGGPVKAVLGLYAMSKMSDKKKDKVKSHFKKRASLLSPVASQFFNKGGPIKAKHGKYTRIPTPHADIAKYVTKSGVIEGPKGEDTFWRKKDSTMTIKKKGAGPSMGRQAPKGMTIGQGPKGISKKKPKIIIIDNKKNQGIKLIDIGDQTKGGQGFTPGWKPHLSVKTAAKLKTPEHYLIHGYGSTYKPKMATAKKGSLLTTGLKGYDTKKVSSKTHARFMKLFKHREAGGLKEATGYKKHLKALGKMQKAPLSGMSKTLPPKTARLLTNLKFAYKQTPKAQALSAAKALGKRTGIGKAVLAATAVAGAYEAGKRKLFSLKDKKKVQKKSTGGEIIIGRGVDLDLL